MDLKRWMKSEKLRVGDVASALQVSQNKVRDVLRGRSQFKPRTIERLEQVSNGAVTIEEVAFGDGPLPPEAAEPSRPVVYLKPPRPSGSRTSSALPPERRGRGRSRSKPPGSKVFYIRMSPEEYDFAKSQGAVMGMSACEYVRRVTLEAVGAVSADKRRASR